MDDDYLKEVWMGEREYDIEAERNNYNEYRRLEEKAMQLEYEFRKREIKAQRDEYELIDRILCHLRGRSISQRTFDILLNELKCHVAPEIDENIEWQRNRLERMKMEYYKIHPPEIKMKIPFILKEEEKDFIEKEDMEL